MTVTTIDRAGTIAALERQTVRLEALRSRLEQGRAALPSDDGIWQGPAHEAFSAGLLLLRRQVAGVIDEVSSAAAASRRALTSVVHGG